MLSRAQGQVMATAFGRSVWLVLYVQVVTAVSMYKFMMSCRTGRRMRKGDKQMTEDTYVSLVCGMETLS